MVTLRLFSLDTILRVLFGITFLLVPFFITSSDPFWFVFDRWSLFYGLTLSILVVWMIRGLRDGVLELRWSFLDILILAFLSCVAVSTYTSVDVRRSVLGYFGDPSGGLLSLTALFVFFIIFCTAVKHVEDICLYYRVLCISLGVLVVSQVLHYFAFSLWSIDTPLLVSQEAFSFIALCTAFLLPGAYLYSERNVVKYGVLVLFSLASLGVLVTSIPPMLLFYLVGLAVFAYVFQKYRDDTERKQLFWVIIPFFVLGTFILITGWSTGFLRGDANHLSYSSSRGIISQGLHERRWFGFGPNTFSYSSGRFRVPQMNIEPTWDKVLGRSYNAWFDMLNDVGVLGFLVFVTLALYFIATLFRGLRRSTEVYFLEYVGLFLSTVGWFLFSLFFSMSGMVMLLGFFCVTLAYSFVIHTHRRTEYVRIPFVFTFWYRHLSSFLSLCMCVVVLFLGVLWVREVAGMWHARRALTVSSHTAVTYLNRAISLEPWRVEYIAALSRVYLSFAYREVSGSAPDPKRIQEAVSLAIESSRRVLKVVPQDGLAQVTLGNIYAEVGAFIEGPHVLAELQYKQALLFEPNNPTFLLKLANLYRIKALRSAGTVSHSVDVGHARTTYEKILVLKPDYAEAYMGLALLEEREENIDSAIQAGEAAFHYAPENTEIMLQLARIYYNTERAYKKGRLFYAAEELLKRVITKEPNSFNAHFLMGSLYKQIGEREKSRIYFEKASLLAGPDEQKLIQKES